MTFSDDLLTDAKDVFLGGEFNEDITYTPAGESAKSIQALVAKDTLEPGEPGGENRKRSLHNQAEIFIANDATKGVTSIDKKDDRVTITDRDGNSKTARVVTILESDAGMWHLLVQW